MENKTYRVVQVHRDRCLVRNENEEYYCVLPGSMRYREEYPVVGDYVEITVNPSGDSLIDTILPRSTIFCRPELGGHKEGYIKTVRSQPLVANIDYVFIITGLDHDFNVNRIARYAAMAVSGGAKPVAVLTKADLCPNTEELEQEVASLSPELDVICVSSYTGYGLDRLRSYLVPGATAALLGSSGAGKSTLVNTLAGEEIMQTGEVREADSKGRHTTTHRELIELDGTYLIDTPGLRELGLIDADEGLADTFSDIAELISRCAFSDCTHSSEPGCAVLKALKEGTLSQERWDTYRKLEQENDWSKSKKREKMKGIAMAKRQQGRTKKR